MQIEAQANAIIARLNIQKVGLAIPIVWKLLTAVLPVLIKCFSQTDAAMNDMTITSQLKLAHQQNPQRLLRRTAREIRFEAESPMTREASFELARATIEQALSVEEHEAVSCCSEAGV